MGAMSHITRASRSLLALVVALGLSVVPLVQVAACSCAMQEMPEAISTAEAAFVGTLVASRTEASEGDLAGPGVGATTWVWEVERSRDPVETNEIAVVGWADDGANCGTSFGVRERWLVLAYEEGGQLTTNGCMMNRRLDGSDPDFEATLDTSLPIAVAGGPTTTEATIPLPILFAAGAAVAILLVGALAFRRERAS